MAAGTNPIYTATPHVSSVQITAVSNGKSDGSGTIGTDTFLAFQAGTNGSYVNRIRFTPVATAASTATAATVLRVYVSSATSGSITASTCWLIAEQAAAAQTADGTTVGIFYFDIPLNFALQANYTILVQTAVANNASTAWQATVFGGDY
jgi:hypothetical protein